MCPVKINELSKQNNQKESSSPVSLVSNNNNGKEEIRELIMDIHEPIDICEKLKQKGVPVKVEHLESGDYVFSNIGIERKTLSDFWTSLTTKDKHIWKQVFELKRHYERPILVIEKFNFQFLRSPLYSKQIWGAIGAIIRLGVCVITIAGVTAGSPDLIEFISTLYFASDKSKKSERPLPEKSKSPKEVFMDTLCMVPGIGPGSAEKVVSRYKTFDELGKVSKEDLGSLIGKSRVKMLWLILHGEEI